MVFFFFFFFFFLFFHIKAVLAGEGGGRGEVLWDYDTVGK